MDDRALRPMAISTCDSARRDCSGRISGSSSKAYQGGDRKWRAALPPMRFFVERSFLRLGIRPAQIDTSLACRSRPVINSSASIRNGSGSGLWSNCRWNQRRALTFSPTAQLLYLFGGALYCCIQYRRLIWSYDLALLLMRCNEQIDWGRAPRKRQPFGLSACFASLTEVREQWHCDSATVADRLGAPFTRPGRSRMLAVNTLLADDEIGLPSA